MPILINGIRSSGSHALQEFLGRGEIVHAPFGELPECSEHHFIVRDPRNVFLSLMKRQGRRLVEPVIIYCMTYWRQATSFHDHCLPYLPWLDVLTPYRYEDLPDPAADTRSDWRTVWNDRIEQEWQDTGGQLIQQRMGYA